MFVVVEVEKKFLPMYVPSKPKKFQNPTHNNNSRDKSMVIRISFRLWWGHVLVLILLDNSTY